MYTLFSGFHPNTGEQVFPTFRVLQEMLKDSLERAVGYYRQNAQRVDSKHILITLLNSLNVPLSMSPVVYNDKVSDIALAVAQILKLTSPLSRGRVVEHGVFYGSNVSEVLVANIDPYDVEDMQKNWRTYRPLRILRHPKTDLSLYLLNGHYTTNEGGLAVIHINIPMLATQYRMWREQEGNASIFGPELIAEFLTRYPITNMLYSHLDIAVFNRLFAMFRDLPVSRNVIKPPFWQLDLSDRVDHVLRQELLVYAKRRVDFASLMMHTPMVTAKNLYDLFKLPNTIYNRQNEWALMLAQLPLIEFLVQQNAAFGNERNTLYLTHMRRTFIQLHNDRSFIELLPAQLAMMTQMQISTQIDPYLDWRNPDDSA